MLEENAPEIAETAAVEPAPEAVPVNVIDVQSDEFKALVMSDEVQEIAMNLIRGEQARVDADIDAMVGMTVIFYDKDGNKDPAIITKVHEKGVVNLRVMPDLAMVVYPAEKISRADGECPTWRFPFEPEPVKAAVEESNG